MAEVRRHDTRAVLDAVAEAARFDSTSWLGASECRAAVIVVRDDVTVAASSQRDLARAHGRALVLEMDGDHFACIKRPREFNELLLAACEGVHA